MHFCDRKGQRRQGVRIYLDTCCLNRPFDDQTQIVVHLETQAILYIQKQISQGIYDLVWSYMLDYENSKNLYEEKKRSISLWHDVSTVKILKSNEDILSYAEELELIGLTAYDALHIACAAYAECDYFITTDKKILNKSIDRLVAVNPVEFVSKMEESYEG